jgi:hypothetical protein
MIVRHSRVASPSAATRAMTQLPSWLMRALNVTPHIAQNTSGRRSAIAPAPRDVAGDGPVASRCPTHIDHCSKTPDRSKASATAALIGLRTAQVARYYRMNSA